jgi:hypothetical protein
MPDLCILYSAFGFCLGVFFVIVTLAVKSSHGVFYTSTTQEGELKYILELEEEPDGLAKRKWLFFKVVKQS